MNNIFKRNKGITVVALVIGVVLLVIIASIAVKNITGDESLIKRSLDAKDKTETEEIKEKILSAVMEYLNASNGDLSGLDDVSFGLFKSKLSSVSSDITITTSTTKATNAFPFHATYKNINITINQYGDITYTK